MNESLMIKELGDGLVLRHATPQDADVLAEFNARIHSDDGPNQSDRHVETWVRDLLERPHPSFAPRDFMIVENTASKQIITGIPYFYRQFGYEMALELDSGRIGYPAIIPQLAVGQGEPYRIRPATEADLPF